MPPTKWEKTKSFSKKGFDAAWNAFDKLGTPVNKLSNKIGSESFWPTTLDKESDKAARILRSFCKDGFYAQADAEAERRKTVDNGQPVGKQKVLKKVPTEVIRKAKGLAIFTTMRTGLWVSGAGGSGVLIARIPETGEWSPPSGIMLHTAGLGFLIGVDIYDCVVVINNYEALNAFKKVRCTLGGEVSAVAGPVGVGGLVESEVHKRQAPLFTYLKSRGFYAGVQIDGTIVIERTDENERFYGERIGVEDILAGKVRHPPFEIETLMNTVKAAQGDNDYDERLLPPPGAPADCEIESGDFAIPDKDDPDPYGVRALEQEGVVIREAGSKSRPSMDTFEFRPSEKSPIYKRWSGMDSRRGSWRNSFSSVNSTDRGTQTDDLPPYPGSASISHRSRSSSHNFAMSPIPLDDDEDHEASRFGDSKINQTGQTSPTGSAFSKARMVIIPKRAPPPLPPRNPERFPAATQLFEDSEHTVDEAAEHTHAEETAQVTPALSPPLPQRTGTFEEVALSKPEEEKQPAEPQTPAPPVPPRRNGPAEALEALNANEDEATKEHHVADDDHKTPEAEKTQPSTSEQAVDYEDKKQDHNEDLERDTDDDFHSVADSLEDRSKEHAQTSDLPKATESTNAADNAAKKTAEEDTLSISHPSISSFEKIDAVDEEANKKSLQPIDEKKDTTASPSENADKVETLPATASHGHEEKAEAEENVDKENKAEKVESSDDKSKDSTFQDVTL